MAPRTSPERSRPYDSPKRREQAARTRRAILAAATARFCAAGYAGTTIASIARSAGVSVPTVEAAFGTKAALLKVAIDVAIAGDDEPVPVLERPWAALARAAVTPQAFLSLVAEVLVQTARRSAALVLVAFEAVRSDARLAPLVDQLKAQRSVTAAWIAEGLADRARLRAGVDLARATDVVWLLMDPAVFERLTSDREWTTGQFATWFADSALRLLTGGRRVLP